MKNTKQLAPALPTPMSTNRDSAPTRALSDEIISDDVFVQPNPNPNHSNGNDNDENDNDHDSSHYHDNGQIQDADADADADARRVFLGELSNPSSEEELTQVELEVSRAVAEMREPHVQFSFQATTRGLGFCAQ
jgi:hypothetical protein